MRDATVNMSPVLISVVLSIATFIISTLTAAVVAGMRWQKLQDKVETLTEDVKEIKGMFTMKLRE